MMKDKQGIDSASLLNDRKKTQTTGYIFILIEYRENIGPVFLVAICFTMYANFCRIYTHILNQGAIILHDEFFPRGSKLEDLLLYGLVILNRSQEGIHNSIALVQAYLENTFFSI